jgi:hypothetical protein
MNAIPQSHSSHQNPFHTLSPSPQVRSQHPIVHFFTPSSHPHSSLHHPRTPISLPHIFLHQSSSTSVTTTTTPVHAPMSNQGVNEHQEREALDRPRDPMARLQETSSPASASASRKQNPHIRHRISKAAKNLFTPQQPSSQEPLLTPTHPSPIAPSTPTPRMSPPLPLRSGFHCATGGCAACQAPEGLELVANAAPLTSFSSGFSSDSDSNSTRGVQTDIEDDGSDPFKSFDGAWLPNTKHSRAIPLFMPILPKIAEENEDGDGDSASSRSTPSLCAPPPSPEVLASDKAKWPFNLDVAESRNESGVKRASGEGAREDGDVEGE